MSEIKEEKLLDEYPSYITIEETKRIIDQLQNCICQVYISNGGKGTGFFCNIKHKDYNKYIPVLITNNHSLGENDIKIDKTIKIALNEKNEYGSNKQIYIDIKIDKDRLVYTSKKYDTTIIEIKKEKDGIKNFLEIDQRMFQENSNVIYYGNSIYLLHYPGNKPAFVSYGIIKCNEQNNHEIIHYCSTERGSSGGPILLLSEMKVFGIHRGAGHLNYNKGSFLKYPIEEFLLKTEINTDIQIKNQIILEVSADQYSCKNNKEVYFLGRPKELNESNTKLFIDGKEFKFQNYFKPKKKGIYLIKLELSINMEDCSYMFASCEHLISIDLSSFNSKKVKNMSHMFNLCKQLTLINLSTFQTPKLENMNHMFAGCTKLETVDLSKFDCKNLVDRNYMFKGCSNIKDIKIKEDFVFNNNKQKNNYYLINSINYELNTSNLILNSFFTKPWCRELKEWRFEEGFQILTLNDNILVGVIEGPIFTPYQNGFFFFKLEYTSEYPMLPPKFIFITKIFHPNISEDGIVSVDILRNNWSPSLRTRTVILSIQSLLGDPNINDFVNQEAASLYKTDIEAYNNTVIEYIKKYANYSMYKNKVNELNLKNRINICNN